MLSNWFQNLLKNNDNQVIRTLKDKCTTLECNEAALASENARLESLLRRNGINPSLDAMPAGQLTA
jgi:hypothetical protein